MYIDKKPVRIVSKGTLLSEVFPAKILDFDEFNNVLLDSGVTFSYKYGDYFNPVSPNWIRATRVTINYKDNVLVIDEVFSHGSKIKNDFTSNEGC